MQLGADKERTKAENEAWRVWPLPEGKCATQPAEDDPTNSRGLIGEVNYDQGHYRIPYASL
jgi:hypothetical protein